MKYFLFFLLPLSVSANSYYLSDEDQKYYRNNVMEGNNYVERIDSLVKEVNKIYGRLEAQNAEMQALKKDVEAFKQVSSQVEAMKKELEELKRKK
jgi:hypothetical protein